MRAFAWTFISVAALVLGGATASAQEKKGGTDTKATGQSERPADPKQAEPESPSHNAYKPKPDPHVKNAATPSTGVTDKKKLN